MTDPDVPLYGYLDCGCHNSQREHTCGPRETTDEDDERAARAAAHPMTNPTELARAAGVADGQHGPHTPISPPIIAAQHAQILRPGDRVLLTFADNLTTEQGQQIQDSLRAAFPEVEFVLLNHATGLYLAPRAAQAATGTKATGVRPDPVLDDADAHGWAHGGR